MPEFRLPLSGDVMQAINPWNWVFRAEGSQVGLVNVYMGHAGDPVVEQKILDDVGTYGRQLGRIGDALAVIINHMDQSNLSADERRAIRTLMLQLEHIDAIKEERQAAVRKDTAAPSDKRGRRTHARAAASATEREEKPADQRADRAG
jgi:hypothetical protein